MMRLAVLAFVVVGAAAAAAATPIRAAEQRWRAVVVREYPHDAEAFTQGLLCNTQSPATAATATLLESTGLYGASTVREIDIESGAVLRKSRLDGALFGEGATLLGTRLYQLTWREATLLEWDALQLKLLRRRPWRISREGWGLAANETSGELIASDGSNVLRWIDVESLAVTREKRVYYKDGMPAMHLNELEVVEGELWANVWLKDIILRIDPQSGKISGVVDISDVARRVGPGRSSDDVANGIAFDPLSRKLFVTGKRWPLLFEVRVERIKEEEAEL